MTETATSSEFLLGLEEYLKYIAQSQAADHLHAVARSLQSQDPELELTRSYLSYLSATLPPELTALADLIHGIAKSNTDTELVYRTLLTYCTRLLNTTSNSPELTALADLCHNIKTAQNQKATYQALLLHSTNVLKIQGLEELAAETGKILRSIDQEDFAEFTVKTQLAKLDRQFPDDKIFRGIMSYLKLQLDRSALQDAFSRSQIKSKIWLVEQLANLNITYYNVLIMAGWFGQLKNIYNKQLTYRKMRVVELDRSACETSDYVFNLSNLDNHKVKAVCADINELTLHKNGYEWPVENFRDGAIYTEKFLPDLIINTSAEHMTEEWFHQLRFKQLEGDPIVAIQSNNLFDIPEHVNCVHSVDHMQKKFPMREILFTGELQLKGYKRVMLIGRV